MQLIIHPLSALFVPLRAWTGPALLSPPSACFRPAENRFSSKLWPQPQRAQRDRAPCKANAMGQTEEILAADAQINNLNGSWP